MKEKALISKYGVYFLFALIVVLFFIYRLIFPSAPSVFTNTDIKMGSDVIVSLYSKSEAEAKAVSDEIFLKIGELENHISASKIESDLYKMNQGEAIESEICADTLKRAIELNQTSDGAFNPLLGSLTDLWGISEGKTEIPKLSDIEKKLKTADIANALTENSVIFLKNGAKIDFGGVGKGMACDIAIQIMQSKGVSGAVVVGGSVAVCGEQQNGEPYTVAVRNPFKTATDTIGEISLGMHHTVVSTSGDYEKFFEKDGKTYHHILDPQTGYPADNELKSVTVICSDGFLSDAYSTAVFVLGLDKGKELIKKYNLSAILIDKDKNVYVTKIIEDIFTLTDNSFKRVDF